MTRILYDLALADSEVRPSPYCWIAKFALLHKGLPFETKAVPFADKEQYPDPAHGKVPILIDGDDMIRESLVIAQWLDKKHPDPALAKTEGEKASASFTAAWASSSLYPALAPMLIPRIANLIDGEDRAYFVSTREKRFGKTLEEVAATPGLAEKAETSLRVLDSPLSSHRYLGGGAPNLSDYIAFAPLMWQRCVTTRDLYDTPSSVASWRERMLDLYDGYARKAKSAEAA